MSSLKSQSSLKQPQTHTVLPSPLCPGRGTGPQEKKWKSVPQVAPWLFPVICAQRAGLPRFPAPSAVLLGSPVLNPDARGTFSWPSSKSPSTPFFPVASLLHSSKLLRESPVSLLHLAFWLPKLCGQGSPQTAWFPLLAWLPSLGLSPGTNLPLHPHF